MIQLSVPDSFRGDDTLFFGSLHIPAQDQRFVVESITLTLTENQYMGRGKSQRQLQHTMGQIVTGKNQYVKAGDAFNIDFSIPYTYVMSPAEKAAVNSSKDRLIIWLLQKIRGVKSEFYLTTTVKLKHETTPYILKKALHKI